MDARWYSPHNSRFVQPDYWNLRDTHLPGEVRHELMRFTGLDSGQLLDNPDQQMAYGYVSGNPLSWVDPFGLYWEKANGFDNYNENALIDNNNDALEHYFKGDGSPKELSRRTKESIMNHPNIQIEVENLVDGIVKGVPRVDMDFEQELSSNWHIGRTKAYYETNCVGGSCTTTFSAPYKDTAGALDGFEDPLDVAELGDRIGLNEFEFELGKPYSYKKFFWSYTYDDPSIHRESLCGTK